MILKIYSIVVFYDLDKLLDQIFIIIIKNDIIIIFLN